MVQLSSLWRAREVRTARSMTSFGDAARRCSKWTLPTNLLSVNRCLRAISPRPVAVQRGRNPQDHPACSTGVSELENPPENPCFGCGPRHARGLRLKFEETTSSDGIPEVRTGFVPQPDEIGWPTLFHHGLHFMVLYEASYWTALTLGRKLWVSHGPSSYNALRLPRVGVAHVARGPKPRRSPEGRVGCSSHPGCPPGARSWNGPAFPCPTTYGPSFLPEGRRRKSLMTPRTSTGPERGTLPRSPPLGRGDARSR